MARRGAVPDLSPLLHGLQRRRDRRSPGHHGAPRPSPVARCRRHLARSDHHVAQQGLGLRRLRLLRRRPRARHARRRRGARHRGRQARHPGHARPRPQSLERPAPVVPRRDLVARLEAPRLVRVGRSQARRLAAQQLGDGLRPPRSRVDVRRGERPVLPQPVPVVAARPQLVERRRSRRVRRHPALLVRPRHRRLSHRRVPLDHQGPRSARQPAGHQRRSLVGPDERAAQRLQRVAARSARRVAPVAQARRRLRPATESSSARPTCSIRPTSGRSTATTTS